MASLESIVVANGCFISAILHRQACASSDEEGFFLGKIENCITNNISDSHIGEREEYLFLNLYDFTPTTSLFSFYNAYGDIQHDALEKLLNGRRERVIGWYKIRRNCSFEVTQREQTIHKNLLDYFHADHNIFFFGLFGSSASVNESTVNTQHCFLKLRGNKFDQLKWRCANLHSGDFLSQYKHYDTTALNRKSNLFREAMKSVEENSNPGNSTIDRGVSLIHHFQSNLQTLQEQLMLKEEEEFRLTEEIIAIERKLSTSKGNLNKSIGSKSSSQEIKIKPEFIKKEPKFPKIKQEKLSEDAEPMEEED